MLNNEDCPVQLLHLCLLFIVFVLFVMESVVIDPYWPRLTSNQSTVDLRVKLSLSITRITQILHSAWGDADGYLSASITVTYPLKAFSSHAELKSFSPAFKIYILLPR